MNYKLSEITAGFFLLLLFACSGTKEIPYAFVPGEGCETSAIPTPGGAELVRYTRNGEWIILSPRGFFDASAKGSSLVTVIINNENYNLDQFYEALYRPDLIEALCNGEPPGPAADLTTILAQGNKAPGLTAEVKEARLTITVSDEGGGAGRLVLYRCYTGEDIPIAVYDITASSLSTYEEKRKNYYEMEFPLAPVFRGGRYGISAFNMGSAIESSRLYFEIPASPLAQSELRDKPALEVIFQGSPKYPEPTEELLSLFTQQENGSLYFRLQIHKALADKESGPSQNPAVRKTVGFDFSAAGEQDLLVLCLPSPQGLDQNGDFLFPSVKTTEGPDPGFGKWELLEEVFAAKNSRVFIFMEPSGLTEIQNKTGFNRLKKLLGNRAALAMLPAGAIDEIADSAKITGQFLGARDFCETAREKGYDLISVPTEDFPFLDPWPGYGEIRMQTLSSGSVIIEDFDRETTPLFFGETMVRKIPRGDYSVSMVYRNGRRETKTATVKPNESVWVVFNYVPDLLAGDLKGSLPAFGVFIEELSPRNYGEVETPVLVSMGMEAHQASLLAGNRFYEAGEYDKAIAEYTRAINAKTDFADGYAWRGNAYRKTGDSRRAIDDYTLALKYKSNYPEVFNYRGYLYAQSGNYDKAIADYSQAIRIRADYADAIFNRGYAYAKKGDDDRAIDDYSRVLRLENENAAAYLERGRAWQRKGISQKAEADFAAAEQLISP